MKLQQMIYLYVCLVLVCIEIFFLYSCVSNVSTSKISDKDFKLVEVKKGQKELKDKLNFVQNKSHEPKAESQKSSEHENNDIILNEASQLNDNQNNLLKNKSNLSSTNTETLRTQEITNEVQCITQLKGLNPTTPFLIDEFKVIITKFFNPCIAPNGERGFLQDSSWSAMGIPCSGGNGKIEWKGYSYDPKMISFNLNLSCPMSPSFQFVKEHIGNKILGLTPEAKLISYTPLVVQYWELDDLSEANVGSQIELRTTHNIKVTWENIKKGEGLKVRIYGRENRWSEEDYLYMALVELFQTGFKTFKLKVIDFKVLNSDDIEKVKLRCLSLTPPRNCQQVF